MTGTRLKNGNHPYEAARALVGLENDLFIKLAIKTTR